MTSADIVADTSVEGVKKKKLFPLVAAIVSVTTAASAADFPVEPVKAPLPAPILFSWTGCYVGVQGGGASGQGEQVSSPARPSPGG